MYKRIEIRKMKGDVTGRVEIGRPSPVLFEGRKEGRRA